MTIYTIGHSNQSIERFVELLREFGIEAVADVRSVPRSAYATQFDQEPLRCALAEAGIRYVYLGKELGGRPRGDEFYDENGHVLYGKVAETPLFRQGIERLISGSKELRVAMVCAEEDPAGCHRRLLVGCVLFEAGIDIHHIRSNSTLESEGDLRRREAEREPQLGLFEQEDPGEWKSIPSVSRKKRQSSFSGF
jgi:uncharacterized protein (DUF488 family)